MRALYVRFGSSSYDDLMENLIKLKQVGSVSAYKGQFEALSNRIKELSEKHRDRKSTRLNSSHAIPSRMPSSA